MTGRQRTAAGLALLAALACEDAVETVEEEIFVPESPHEAYAWGLEQAGLGASALARDWLRAADWAVTQPFDVATPFRETGFLPPDAAGALGFRIQGVQGHRVTVDFALAGDPSARVFVDVFHLPRRRRRDPEPREPVRFAHAEEGQAPFSFEPERDEAYIVRLQPELLRGGRYTVTITTGPTLGFPVENGREHDIGSFFGDARDGGARNHHGIDIFARRNTPALAPAVAEVYRVQTTPVGGRVVWLRDERGQRFYYAHLDSQHVRRGQRVQRGDTVGFVGNTGNARTTPPHLHFGVYARGPVNPMPYVSRIAEPPAELTADIAAIGTWMRAADDAVPVRVSPDRQAESVHELPRHAALLVLAGTADWYRVQLPNGDGGFVRASRLEPAHLPLRGETLPGPRALHALPLADAAVVAQLGGGQSVDVLGTFAGFLLVPGPAGRAAWLAVGAEAQLGNGS